MELSGLGLAAAVTPRDTKALKNATTAMVSNPPQTGSQISVWVTAGEDRFAAAPRITWDTASGLPSGDQIQLDPSKKFQEILGFGGAFTDAACYTFSRLPPNGQEHLLHEMFHPSEMGLSVCRTCIGASDYSASLYSFDDGAADPDLRRESTLELVVQGAALPDQVLAISICLWA